MHSRGKRDLSNPKQEEEAVKVFEVVDSEEDFEVFNWLDPLLKSAT